MTWVEARTVANRDSDNEEGLKHQVESNIAEQEAEVKVAAISRQFRGHGFGLVKTHQVN